MSSTSFLDPRVKGFLDQTEIKMNEAVANKEQLKNRVIEEQQAKDIASIACSCFEVNARSAQRKSMTASVSRVLGLAMLSGVLLNQLKGNKISPPLLTAALVASLALMALWVKFRNYANNLTTEAEAALKNGEVGSAIELIAQGADRRLYHSVDFTAEKGNFKVWLYLALLNSFDGQYLKNDMSRVYHRTHSIAIARAAVDLGASSLATIYGSYAGYGSYRIGCLEAELAFDLGFDPNEVLPFAKNAEVAKLAIERGAKVKDPGIITSFMDACKGLRDDLIEYFIQKGATSVDFGITNYAQWESDCHVLSDAEKAKLIEEKKYYAYQLVWATPFECYMEAYYEKYITVNPQVLSRILKLFKPDKELGEEISKISDASSLMFALNDNGIRVRTAACEKLLKRSAKA